MCIISVVFALTVNPTIVYANGISEMQNANEKENLQEVLVSDEATINAVNRAEKIVSANASEKSIEEVEEYALSFMQKSQPGFDIKVLSICPLYGLNNEITGYYVLFLRNEPPNGYLLISFLHEGEPVVELAFEGLGIFDGSESFRTNLDKAQIKYLGSDELYIKDSRHENAYKSLYDGHTITGDIATNIYNDALLSLQNDFQNHRWKSWLPSKAGL